MVPYYAHIAMQQLSDPRGAFVGLVCGFGHLSGDVVR